MKRLMQRIVKLGQRRALLLGALCVLPLASGCFAHVHTLGDGPQGGEVRTERMWYAAYGFVPLDRIDSKRLMGGSGDYRITTAFRAGDVFLNIFTGPFGFFRLTSRFEK